MHIHSNYRLPRERHGAALVVVLAFVVLLTGLVVAFFSRAMSEREVSNSSANQVKVDLLAQGALDAIVGDLKQEIAAGSTPLPNPNPNNYPVVYQPNSPSTVMPARSGTSGGMPSTLLKQSAFNQPFYAGTGYDTASVPAPNRASQASTGGTSQNGRTLTPGRWNSPLLLSSTAADCTPTASVAAPDWIYIDRSGSNPVLASVSPSVTYSPTSPTAVVGRYAYRIYDEGALLDVNVAGYPYILGNPPPQYADKGSLAFADLTALGLNSFSVVNEIVGWRNYASAQPSGTFPSFSFPSISATNYYNCVSANTTGFLSVSGSSYNGQTDHAFLSRQELIGFMTQGIATPSASGSLQTVLQYLGTFSRAVNAPSWGPPADASTLGGANGPGNIYAYKTNADTPALSGTGNPNRNLPNVRWLQNATVTHYNDDGTAAPYVVNAGDPMLQRRFSLAKIKWLDVTATPQGPDLSNGKDQAIAYCFGLKWDAANWRWEYIANRTGPVAIMTLSEVADSSTPKNPDSLAPANPREPNFFELLKAGILAGSLGRDPGPHQDFSQLNSSTQKGVYGDFNNGGDNFKSEPNLQILQIGADIIDQADADSYPTAIHFNAWGLTKADDLALQTVYGIENLPYLLDLGVLSLSDPKPVYSGTGSAKVLTTPGVLKVWVQPELWNPHQAPATAPAARPSQFRAYLYGSMYPQWANGNSTSLANQGPAMQYDDGTGAGSDIGSGSIYFTDPGDSTSPFYNGARLLTTGTTLMYGSTPVVDTANTPAQNCNIGDPGQYPNYTDDYGNYEGTSGTTPPSVQNRFAAFYAGEVDSYGPVSGSQFNKYAIPNPLVYFALQYKGPDGNYHPYNFISRFQAAPGVMTNMYDNWHGGSRQTNGLTSWEWGFGAMRIDPRTDRFSVSAAELASNYMCANCTVNPSSGDIHQAGGGAGAPCLPTPSSSFVFAGTTTTLNALWAVNIASYSARAVNDLAGAADYAYYLDQDGIVRPGDFCRANRSTGDGWSFYNANAVTATAQVRRPVILNRPFRSVGELGFAFRDLPFKTLDFWSDKSADAALLDLFSVNDQPAMIAGQINPNNASAPVLQAVLSGGSKSDALGVQMSGTEAQTLAARIAADIAANGPYANRADLATRLGPLVSGTTSAVAFNINTTGTTANWANKAYAEAPVRALADVTNTRTWNLMIDVIAQTGNFPPGATDLNRNFIVQGEHRYWLHIAIDRFTGKVVDQQLEPVYE